MRILLSIVSITLHFLLVASKNELNDRPIIAVLAQDIKPAVLPVAGTNYISAAYVKYLESAGARVVPIPTTIRNDKLLKILHSVNGVLFPGGNASVDDSAYQRNAKAVYDFAVQQNSNGNFFPLWGTCLGMQQLLVLAAGKDIMSHSIGTEDVSMALNLEKHASESRMFSIMPTKVREILTEQQVTYNAHYNCVSVATYNENKKLQQFFQVISTNQDSKGMSFLSTIEGYHYPFYGIQWHAEMVPFEFTVNEGLGKNINHSPDAVLTSQYFANFFVNEARKSTNRFASKDEEISMLIYNFQPVYSASFGWFDEQVYVF